MNSIEVKNLTKKFGDFISVNNISFNVRKAEVFGFLGANGAGKSTTIRMLCGILKPTSGDAIVGGFSVMNQPEKVKLKIGYMSQKFSLYNDLTVEENIDFFAGIYGLEKKLLQERKEWILSIADLKGRENLLTGLLPGGIKQRLALGTAVIHRPEIVFLDEPTSGVDPIARRNFWELINYLSDSGTTVVVTTHYLEEAEYCNNIVLIDAGKIIAEGNPKELKSKYISSKLLELECERLSDAIEILSLQNFVSELNIFGNTIHLSVNENYITEKQIIDILSAQRINVFRMSDIIPTLEDVFVQLVDKK
jgi:ABC-2 type transport system ATP-binding protein